MRSLLTTLTLAFSALSFAAPLQLQVNLMMDGEAFTWDTEYTSAAGQTFTINLLKFYVSNVALVNADGSEVPLDGFDLVSFEPGDVTQSAGMMTLDAPTGSYSGIRFDIGVPRELNHLDATLQDAPLGVDAGMYWAWNPGYIFYRLEGQVQLDGVTEPWLLHMGTDAFRLPVRAQDLLTGTVSIDVPAEGTALAFDLDMMQAFTSGIAGGDYDLSKDSYRAVHGGPVSAQAYVNLLNAVTLSDTETNGADEASAEVETTLADSSTETSGGKGTLSGTLSLPDSVAGWDHVIVLACPRADAEDRRCDAPIVLTPEPASPDAREAAFMFKDLPAGEYSLYALNDKDGNERHTMQGADAEEIGVLFEPVTFDLKFVPTGTTELDLALTGIETDAETSGEMNHSEMNHDNMQDGEMNHSGMQDSGVQDSGVQDSNTQDGDAETATESLELVGGNISGTVRLPESIESWDSVIVLACTRDDARCETPAQVTVPEPSSSNAREASFSLTDLAAGEYAVYALNDKDGNVAHTMDGVVSEELGLWAEPGTFNPLYVSPPQGGIDFSLIGSE